MIKQRASFFFLMLAYLIMMGHNLIPHHHHHFEGEPVSQHHHHHDDHSNDHHHNDNTDQHIHFFAHAEHVEHTVIQSSTGLISFLLIKSTFPVAELFNGDNNPVPFLSFVTEYYPPPDNFNSQFILTPSLTFRGPPSFSA